MPAAATASLTLTIGLLILCFAVAVALAYFSAWPASVAGIETQEALAKLMDVSQVRVSQIENGEIGRTEVGTLRSYIEALGGRLRIVAEIGDTSVTITD